MKLRERELACREKELSIRELEATVALSTNLKSGNGAQFDSVDLGSSGRLAPQLMTASQAAR
eukprot:3283546-Rhodomonas_salina.1